jgi:hypothetical protein
MDGKAWANLGVNSASFSIKAIAWTYMVSIYDTNEEAKIGEAIYEKQLWENNG